MSSESLFYHCQSCGKLLSTDLRACTYCGAKRRKRLSPLWWVGMGLFTLMWIGAMGSEAGLEHVTDSATENPQSASRAPVLVPSDQQRFVQIIQKYINAFPDAKNELQQAVMRQHRKNDIAEAFDSRYVSAWIGTINRLETTADGRAILAINITPEIAVKTWNNTFSDFNTNTLISKESSLYQQLINLTHGQLVEFSGYFINSQQDYIRELSMTNKGAIMAPGFLFKFQSVNPINNKGDTTWQ